MFRNYLLVALRNLFRNHISSLVNILGLAIGMAAFVLIIQYVRFELSYDNFHEKQDVIFRIQQDRYNQGELTTRWAAGCSAVGQALYENFEEVENFTRFQKFDGVMTYGDRKFREDEIYAADTSFFEIFSFKILKGDGHSSLENPLTIILSESTARKYFGDEDPIGKSLRFNGGLEFEVTGVFEDAPRNSHLKPQILASWATMVHLRGTGTWVLHDAQMAAEFCLSHWDWMVVLRASADTGWNNYPCDRGWPGSSNCQRESGRVAQAGIGLLILPGPSPGSNP